MRSAATALGLVSLVSLACKIDNPAFLVTEGGDGGSTAVGGDTSTSGSTGATTGNASGSASASASGTTSASATTDPDPTEATTAIDPTPATTDPATTDPATTDPLTTEPATTETTGATTLDTTTTESTGQPDTTSEGNTTAVDTCANAAPSAFDLKMSTTVNNNFVCNFDAFRSFHAEVADPVGENGWQLRVCPNVADCKDPGKDCASPEIVTLRFEGPVDLIPDLSQAGCHNVSWLARAKDIDDPTRCRLRTLRLADATFDVPAVDYIGAVSVPDTSKLPPPWPLIEVFNFSVAPDLLAACDGEPTCGLTPGTYKLALKWGVQMVQHFIAEGGELPEKMPAKENGQATTIPGVFHNLASHADPGGTCDNGLEFDWVWLADVIAPDG